MARRSDHTREELQKLILDAALDLTKEGGLDALTARNIALKTGYTAGTLYNIFDSMHDLILHINALTMEKLYSTLGRVKISRANSVEEKLLQLAHAYRKFIAENKNLWLLLFETSLPEKRADLEWYQKKVDQLFELIENIISSHIKNQDVQTIRMAARVLWSSFHGLCYLQEKGQFQTVGKGANLSEMTKLLVENFMKGLAAK